MEKRCIRFRVWDSQKKRMYGCMEISWMPNGKMSFRKGSGIEMDENLGDVLMQYIGLKENMSGNQCELYQGDIIEFDDTDIGGEKCVGEIIWNDDQALGGIGWALWVCGPNGGYKRTDFLGNIRILGNIHENRAKEKGD